MRTSFSFWPLEEVACKTSAAWMTRPTHLIAVKPLQCMCPTPDALIDLFSYDYYPVGLEWYMSYALDATSRANAWSVKADGSGDIHDLSWNKGVDGAVPQAPSWSVAWI
jgi:hypothetical protein